MNPAGPRPDAAELAGPVRAALGAAALLLAARSMQQLAFVASLGLSLAVMWVWGRALLRRALGVAAAGPFTAIFLGQLALLAAASVGSAAGSALHAAIGLAPPALAVVLPATAALLLLDRRVAPPAAAADARPGSAALTLVGLGCLGAAMALFARNLTALGLDVHEHIAWTQQILRLGRVPWSEPGTAVLSNYPRSFHLLAASWSAAGLCPISGPFVELLPFLESSLACLSVAELMAVGLAPGCARARRGWAGVGAGAFLAYAMVLVPMVYPAPDLSGTPRMASNGLLLAPLVLLLLGRVGRAPAATCLALGAAPLLAAWTLTWNPIVPVLLLACGGPAAAALAVALASPWGDRPLRRILAQTCTCALLAALVLAQDPWIVAGLASRVAPVATLLRRAGLVTYEEALRRGEVRPRERAVHPAAPAPPCRDAACVARAARGAALDGLGVPARALRATRDDLLALLHRPTLDGARWALAGATLLQPAAFAPWAALPTVLVLWAGVVAALAGWRARRRAGTALLDRLWWGSLAAVAASGVVLRFAAVMAAALNDQSHELRILQGYLGFAPYHVSIGLLWFPFLGAVLLLAAPWITGDGSVPAVDGRRGRARAIAAAVAALLAPQVARLNLPSVSDRWRFSTPSSLHDLAALRRLEEAIPPEDGVLIPAKHLNVEDWEHWVIPVGPTAALLPYGTRRYLFDVGLGASYVLVWRDLEDRLCSQDPAVRRTFLEGQRARWLLVRGAPGASAADSLAQDGPCAGPLANLRPVLPPVRSVGGVHLFRLRDAP